MSTILSWDFQVSAGYNRLFLIQQVRVYKGSLIRLIQTTGRIAMDQSNNFTYSDLIWQTYAWLKLNTNSNWRFLLNPMNDFSVYQNYFNLNHKYSSTGLYTVKISFSGLIYQQNVSITDCKFLKISSL